MLFKRYVFCVFFLLSVFPIHALVMQQIENPRSLALGKSYVMLLDNNYALANQASASFLSSSTLALSYHNRFVVKELSSISARYSMPTPWMNVGFLYRFFGFSLYHEMIAGVSVAKALSSHFSLGAQVDYVSVYVSPEEGYLSTFVPQLGIIIKATPSVNLGIHAYNFTFANLQTSYQEEYLQPYLTAGLDYHMDQKVLLLAQIHKPLREESTLSAGIEYTIAPEVIARTGMSLQQYLQPSFGVGLNIDVLQFDVGFQYHPVLGMSVSSGVVFIFGK